MSATCYRDLSYPLYQVRSSVVPLCPPLTAGDAGQLEAAAVAAAATDEEMYAVGGGPRSCGRAGC